MGFEVVENHELDHWSPPVRRSSSGLVAGFAQRDSLSQSARIPRSYTHPSRTTFPGFTASSGDSGMLVLRIMRAGSS